MIDLRPEAIERRTAMIAGLKAGEAGYALVEYLEEVLRGLERDSFDNADFRLGEIRSLGLVIETLQADYAPQQEETQ